MSLIQPNISSLTQNWLRESLTYFLRPVEIVRGYRREDFRPDFIAAMIATVLATLFLPLQFAVLAGVLVAFLRYVAKTSTPNVKK